MAAFALTNGIPLPSVPEKGRAPSKIVLPIDASTNITLERVRYVSDERGCSWRGVVAETGESALLMRGNDGHRTRALCTTVNRRGLWWKTTLVSVSSRNSG